MLLYHISYVLFVKPPSIMSETFMTTWMSEPVYEVPARGESLAEQVYRQLCVAILAGSFAPKERISIRRLADELQVSATPAREAVLRLISDGVLQATERNAIIVPSRTVAEIEEIFEIRRDLEGALAAKAASRLDAEDIEFLTQTQAVFLQAIAAQNYEDILKYNSQFHFRIYRSAGLPVYLKIIESLWLRIGPMLRYMYPTLMIDRESHHHHEDIIDCARSHDAQRLKAAIIADLGASEDVLHRHLEQAAAEPRRRKYGAQE
jgi:GntR family colanic acid and biofilm gene transcriptional regulator